MRSVSLAVDEEGRKQVLPVALLTQAALGDQGIQYQNIALTPITVNNDSLASKLCMMLARPFEWASWLAKSFHRYWIRSQQSIFALVSTEHLPPRLAGS
jgi:hypothetical protein